MWESAAGWSRFFITSTGLTIMDYTFNIATRISGSHIFGIFGVARKILANSHFIGELGQTFWLNTSRSKITTLFQT